MAKEHAKVKQCLIIGQQHFFYILLESFFAIKCHKSTSFSNIADIN